MSHLSVSVLDRASTCTYELPSIDIPSSTILLTFLYQLERGHQPTLLNS